MAGKLNDTEKRVLKIHESLFRMLYDDNNPIHSENLQEFTKGGISACCAVLKVMNPLTGMIYTGEINHV